MIMVHFAGLDVARDEIRMMLAGVRQSIVRKLPRPARDERHGGDKQHRQESMKARHAARP